MEKKVFSSLIWKLLERSGTYLIQFIIQIILARILMPEDYGIIAIVTIFITIANVFVQTGFNTALIQKKQIDELDKSSVFYLSLFVAMILYVIIFFWAPIIADFYNNKLLESVLRILSLTLFLGAFNSIQTAIVARNMQFKKYFFSSLISIIVSGTIGIFMAYNNFGIWALVVQQLMNMLILVIILVLNLKWTPKLKFSIKRIKTLFGYGWKLLVSSLIDNIYTNLYDLVIGKKYTSADLAFYNRGKQFPHLIISNINGSISTVLLPTMSQKQDDLDSVKELTRKSIVISSFILFPMIIGLAVIARPLVSLILTDKWLDCVPFLQLLCFSYIFWPIHTTNLQAINALGRSDIFLKLEIIKKTIGIIALIITIPMGLYAMAIGQIITGIISTFINSYPNKKLLNYSYNEQMKDIIPSLIISGLMAIFISPLLYLKLGNLTTIILQVIIGMIVYIFGSIAFKVQGYLYIIEILKIQFRKK